MTSASSALYLLFECGGGQTDPHVFVFRLTGVHKGESVSWTLNPTSMRLVGLRFLSAGLARRGRS